MLSEQQELSVAAARLSETTRSTVESLVRAGWLRRDGGRIAFAHEAFFDYAYAQQHMRSGLPLLSLLRSGEQHLFRRAQVRQILALEREQDREQYLRDVRDDPRRGRRPAAPEGTGDGAGHARARSRPR